MIPHGNIDQRVLARLVDACGRGIIVDRDRRKFLAVKLVVVVRVEINGKAVQPGFIVVKYRPDRGHETDPRTSPTMTLPKSNPPTWSVSGGNSDKNWSAIARI